MRLAHIVFGLWMLAFSAMVSASGTWYLGANYKYLDLDNAREFPCHCNMSGSQTGLQVGKYLSENLSLEVDHSVAYSGDGFDASSVSGVFWSGNDESDYRYYALLGLNYFNFGEDAGYPAGENEQTTQVVFGLGVGKKVAKNYQFRADMRLMGGHDVDAEDVGFQISLNRFLGDASAPVKSSPIASPAAQESTVKTITINLNVEFEFDKATVMSIYSDQLATVAKAMQEQADIELVLEGHTDSVGSNEYNNDLSARRAEAVKQKLAADYGIAASRISTIGYGESRPIASNDTAAGRALNRRVVGEMSFSEVVVD